jgi:hypothetical protein
VATPQHEVSEEQVLDAQEQMPKLFSLHCDDLVDGSVAMSHHEHQPLKFLDADETSEKEFLEALSHRASSSSDLPRDCLDERA